MSISDAWTDLQSLTDARIALGRSGGSLTTRELLKFRKDHALAKDAVWTPLNEFDLINRLDELGVDHITLTSMVTSRSEYLQRPDLGRKLSEQSRKHLKELEYAPSDIALVVTEGLSASAIESNALGLLRAFLPSIQDFRLAPIIIVKNGRVAVGDEIGELLQSKVLVMLIGERPGLSSPDSLGLYITYDPKVGKTDESRNCISNIRNAGLSYTLAAQKLNYLIRESIKRQLSGVNLKDEFDASKGIN